MKVKININELLGISNETVVEDETSLQYGLGIDSLKLVDLLLQIEEELGLTLDEEDIDPSNIRTVGDIKKLIETTLAKGN